MDPRPGTARTRIAAAAALLATLVASGRAEAQDESPAQLPDSPAGSNILPAPGANSVRSPAGAPENLPVPRPFGLPPFLPGSEPYQPADRFVPMPPFGGPRDAGPLESPSFSPLPFGPGLLGLPSPGGPLGVPNIPALPDTTGSNLERSPEGRFRIPDVDLPEPDASPFLPEPPRGAEAGPELTLDQVLASVDNAYPPLLQVVADRGVAAGELVAAAGAFDLDIKFDIRNYMIGYYKRIYHSYYFEQPTTWNGVKFFAGYRLGVGEYPVYLFPFRTYAGGEFLGGFEFPFLKNRAIDAKRAKLWQQRIERQKVEPKIQQYRIETIRKATKAYWNWVNAGQRYRVFDELLRLSLARDRFIQNQIRTGQLAQVALADNRQFVLQRESDLLGARRDFQQASIDLSLFLRDRYCLPVVPQAEQLPGFPPTQRPTAARLGEDINVALRLRPELRVIQLQMRKVGIDLDLARNQRLPGLNLYIYGSEDIGEATYPSPRSAANNFSIANQGPFALETSLLFDMPLQRRQARGREQSAQAAILQLRQQERFAADTIAAEVKEAMAALQAAYFQMLRAREATRLAEQLEEAERRAFELGTRNVLSINVRELFTANARIKALDAEAKVLTSEADFRAALGLDAVLPDGHRPPPIGPRPAADPTAAPLPPPVTPRP